MSKLACLSQEDIEKLLDKRIIGVGSERFELKILLDDGTALVVSYLIGKIEVVEP